MAYQSDNWMDWLRLFGQGASAFGSAAGGIGGLSGVGLPDTGAVAPPPVVPVAAPPPVTGGAMMPDAGAFMPSSGSPAPWLPNGVPPAAAPAARPPPRPAVGPAKGPAQLDTDLIMPGPDTFKTPYTAPYLDTDAIMPGPDTPGFRRSWWDRNIGDPLDKAWDKAWKEDPKTGMSPGMKALSGVGSMVGKLGAAPAATPLPAAPSGASAYKPSGQINASQMALAREQARQLLMQRATLNAPWLRLRQQQQTGLLGGGAG